VGQDGILRGDWQSPRVPVANRHAACQAAPQKNISYRSRHCCNPGGEISLFPGGGLNMRISQLVLALAGTLMCTGCSEMIFLHPFVADSDAIQDARLPGVWLDGDNPMYIVRPDGNGYTISQSDKSSPVIYKLKAKMLKVGDARILDLTPADEDAFQIAAHTPLRVWIEAATLRLAFLDSKWLQEKAGAQLATQAVDRLLITSPQEDVTRFLLTYGGDERAYGKMTVLSRQQ
jgi:hypothetical protein